ncbi:MAG TPA: hypothetical protein VFQ61_24945 [Polyangiaceae bacterium]|nr:hypothetical protein [Polyangiaceae bacterium]
MSDGQVLRKLSKWSRTIEGIEKSGRLDQSGSLAKAYAQRGSLYSEIGLAEAGLCDALRALLSHEGRRYGRAEAQLPDLMREYRSASERMAAIPATLWAQLGECFRVYTRDVLLSRSRRGAEQDVAAFIEYSLACFERASSALSHVGSSNPRQLGWVKAHHAAVLTMKYWMSLSVDSPAEQAFLDAEELFRSAEQCYGEDSYDWAKRFRAFLYALRGRNDERDQDYHHARMLLHELENTTASQQSSFDRSMAMLASYDVLDEKAAPNRIHAGRAGDVPAGTAGAQQLREQAARESIERGFCAIRKDPEEFVAAFFAATSQWYLSKSAAKDEECERFEATLGSMLDAAEIRANNAISQALMCLAGVQLLKALRSENSDEAKKPAKRAKSTLRLLQRMQPDLETRAMLHRNLLWSKIQDDSSEEARRVREVFGEETFKKLKTLFSVSPGTASPRDSE